MIHQTAFVKSSDGINLFSQMWKPNQSPNCVICLVHGIGEHSSRYDDWAKRFVSNNIAVVAFDQRGHGQSQGKRGVIPSYDSLLDDVDLLLKECEKQFPDIPIVLYGHSMGGSEVLSHLSNRQGSYKAVIATSPWLIAQQSPPKFLIPFVGLCKRLFPNLSLKTKMNPDLLSRDLRVGEEYMNDPLVHPMVSFRLFYEAYQNGYSLLDGEPKLNKPLLLLHGNSDQITSYKASQQFASNAGQLCYLHLFEGAFHELQNDSCKDEAFDIILTWIHKDVISSS